MKVSYEWLKSYVPLTQSQDEIEKAFTLLGFEVEGVEKIGLPDLENVVVGEVLERNPHPNADRLSVCRVSVGAELGERTIVCGAQNYKVGDRVPVALSGAVLPGNFKIKRSKLRGVESDGMMCSGKEIGYGEDGAGLLILENRPEPGTPINDVFPDNDLVFDVEITPNRPDALSHIGLARELAAYFDLDLTYPETHFQGALDHAAPYHGLLDAVAIEAEEDCPLYIAHVITGVKIGPSPDWMQRRLRAVGLRPINNVVDVTNFVLMELGQPLHAFDAAKLVGSRIIVRHASDGEKMETLDGKERTLSSRMLVIADGAKPVAIAGVMGGATSEVDNDTTDIVLESAYFRPASIRWTSRRLGLSSDSSYRYERGVDPMSLKFAAWRAIDLLVETAGGKLSEPVFKAGAEPTWDNEIRIAPNYVREQIGFEVSDDEIRSALESLELNLLRDEEEDGRRIWTFHVPSFRGDLDRPIDLVEEFLRIYGTDKIPSAPVVSPGLVQRDDSVTEFSRSATSYLVGQHFHECVNYTLRPGAEIRKWVSQSMADELALKNPIVEDQTHLRASLIPGLLDALQLNQARHTAPSRLFECGRTFRERDGVAEEMVSVGFILAEDEDERRWLNRSPVDFYTAKNLLFRIGQLAGVDLDSLPIGPVSEVSGSWQEGHSAGHEDAEQGILYRIGLVNLGLLKELGIRGRVYAGFFSVTPERLANLSRRRSYKPFSLFPSALRDLALVVDGELQAGEVKATLEAVGRKTANGKFDLESVALFDVYEGKGLPENTKSLAFSLTFRATDRTLTDEEVNAIFQKIQTEIETNTPYQIRK